MDENVSLVVMARAGDESAFEELLRKYQGLLVSMSKKYSDMCQEPLRENEDFLQEAKIAFFNAVNTYDEKQNRAFGAYAKVCIRNKLISCVRVLNSKKRKKSIDLSVRDNDDTSIQEKAISKERKKELYQIARQHLSRYEYLIFEMYSSGQKAKEISAKIGKSEKSVNNAICRMKSKLSRL